MKGEQHHITQLTDSELIDLYKKNENKKLIGVLFKRYMTLVYGISLKYLKERSTAQDLTMQVFEKLLSSLKTQEIGNFKSWLYVLTKNECLMHLRKHKRLNGQVQSLIDDDFMEISIPVHHEEETLEKDIGQLDYCIERLKNEQQHCIKLFYIEKKCYQEVCDITGFEMKKVKSYLQNGRRNLKLCIEKLREQEEQTY
ncbi:hypothetical protein BFP71_17015 [Roseivirga misakiensis]|uniref:RNA polymerase subunit sigma-70 n=1 Tax=Roseivirga misakiensis TaxID=1563681 RepID=A0A1E5T2L8_9BACT|nr:hypothetical protein BFP71_17015 [Roseivirga misakiensis]